MVTIEAGGLLSARNLEIDTDILKVDKKGLIDLSGQGLAAGDGAGATRAGGSFGGRGSIGSSSSKLNDCLF